MESGEMDLLSKQAVLNLPRDKEFNLEGKLLAEYINVKDIEALPTVQSQSTAGQLNDSAQSTNLIDRQHALEAVSDCGICTQKLVNLPSAQPSQDKYEYHYDHTDCIWYRPEARNRCPATCAQYRDGWNDAMNYIFRDGEGYRPFRRDKKYEG